MSLVVFVRAIHRVDHPKEGDRTATWQYFALLDALTAIATVRVKVDG